VRTSFALAIIRLPAWFALASAAGAAGDVLEGCVTSWPDASQFW